MNEKVAGQVLDALVGAVDRRRFADALASVIARPEPAPQGSDRAAGPGPSGGSGGASGSRGGTGPTATAVLHKIVLSDILDESILGARPGQTSFPLRMFFGTLGDELEDDVAFALANGLNFFFRVPMDEEPKMWLGLEVSRLYYRYAAERPLDPELVPQLSPLLARLMSTELSNLSFESADTARVFDSSVHERVRGGDASSPRILSAKSFLCRVVSNGRVRARAQVRT